MYIQGFRARLLSLLKSLMSLTYVLYRGLGYFVYFISRVFFFLGVCLFLNVSSSWFGGFDFFVVFFFGFFGF